MNPNRKMSVTKIISEIFPTDPRMFADALNTEQIAKKKAEGKVLPNSIAEKLEYLNAVDVMKMLTSFGTIIHLEALDRGLLGMNYPIKDNVMQNHITALNNFFIQTGAKLVLGETCVETEDYTGTLDGVLLWDGKYHIIDWKTWTAYKYIYGFKNDILKKNGEPYARSNDVKKTSLQLSMYREPLEKKIKLDGMRVLWVTEMGVFWWEATYDLELFYDWKKKKSGLSL